MNDVWYWSFSSNNVNGNVPLKLQQRQMKETAHLVIGEEPMRLSTKGTRLQAPPRWQAPVCRNFITLTVSVITVYIVGVQILRKSRYTASWVEQRFIPELLGSSKFQDFSSEVKLTKWLYLGGDRTDRTKDTEVSWIQLRVEKICKTENISIAKFLYKKVKRWFERNQIFLSFCRKKP